MFERKNLKYISCERLECSEPAPPQSTSTSTNSECTINRNIIYLFLHIKCNKFLLQAIVIKLLWEGRVTLNFKNNNMGWHTVTGQDTEVKIWFQIRLILFESKTWSFTSQFHGYI